MDIILFLLLLFAVMLQEISRSLSIRTINAELWQKTSRWQMGASALHIVWLLSSIFILVPIWTLLLINFFIWLFPLYRQKNRSDIIRRFILMDNLLYGSILLISLGLISFAGSMVPELADGFSTRYLILLAAEGSLAFFRRKGIAIYQGYQGGGEERKEDYKKSHFFVLFLCACILYMFFDSFLCEYSAKDIYVSLILVFGNVLSLFLFFLFLHHDYVMEKSKALEEEMGKLEAEKARVLVKTEQVKQIAKTDKLTGAMTRGYGLEKARCLCKQGASAIVVFIDLDGLKKINDRMGHKAGDSYLRTFTDRIRKGLREEDLLIRFGGDEFLIVMPNISVTLAKEKMLELQESMLHSNSEGEGISFSFGITEGNKGIEESIKQADSAMYLDKKRKKRRM